MKSERINSISTIIDVARAIYAPTYVNEEIGCETVIFSVYKAGLDLRLCVANKSAGVTSWKLLDSENKALAYGEAVDGIGGYVAWNVSSESIMNRRILDAQYFGFQIDARHQLREWAAV